MLALGCDWEWQFASTLATIAVSLLIVSSTPLSLHLLSANLIVITIALLCSPSLIFYASAVEAGPLRPTAPDVASDTASQS